MIYKHGDEYLGEWAKGMKHGIGKYTRAFDNSYFISEWEEDVEK
jgi:hypothetical protein